MPDIYPAILTSDYETLEQQVRAAEGFASFLHIDIADGHFVPNVSITAADVRSAAPKIPFEIHLMVDRPEDILQDVLATGAKRIILHRQSAQEGEALFAQIRSSGCEASLAVSPMTSTADLPPFLPFIQQLIFLAVDPGFQGGALVPGVLHKALAFRSDYPEIPLEIDGGIKTTNVDAVAASGADRFAIGSAIWQTPDPAAAFQFFLDAFTKSFRSSS